MNTAPKKTTRHQRETAAHIDAHRDELGRMHCDHGTPGGAEACALCRRLILTLHEGYHGERRQDDTAGVPMPDWFRQGLAHPEQWREVDQPTLDGSDDS